MAFRAGEAFVEFGAKGLSSLQSSIGKLVSKFDNLKKSVRGSESSLSRFQSSVDSLSGSMDDLASSAGGASGAVSSLLGLLDRIPGGRSAASISVFSSGLGTPLSMLVVAGSTLSRVLLRIGRFALPLVGRALSAMFSIARRVFSAIVSLVSGLLSMLARVATRIATIGAALAAAGFAFLVKTLGDVQSGFAEVRKTTGLAGEEFEILQSRLIEMGKRLPIAFEELQAIAAVAGQLGIRGADNISKFTETIAKLAATSSFAAEEAALTLAKIINIAPDLEIDDVDRLASAMTRLAAETTASEPELAELAKRLVSVGSSLGLTTDQVLGLSAALIDAGVPIEVAGTNMSAILSEIGQAVAKGGADLGKWARAAGTNAEDFARAVRTRPIEAIKQLAMNLSRMDRIARLETLNELGLDGARAGRVMLGLAAVFPNLEAALTSAADEMDRVTALEKEFAIASEGLWKRLRVLWNNIKLVAYELGVNLLPILGEGVDALTEFVQKAGEAFKPFAEDVIGRIGPRARRLFEDFRFFADNMGLTFEFLGSRIDDVFHGIVENLKRLPRIVAPIAKTMAELFIRSFDNIDPMALFTQSGREELLRSVRLNFQRLVQQSPRRLREAFAEAGARFDRDSFADSDRTRDLRRRLGEREEEFQRRLVTERLAAEARRRIDALRGGRGELAGQEPPEFGEAPARADQDLADRVLRSLTGGTRARSLAGISDPLGFARSTQAAILQSQDPQKQTAKSAAEIEKAVKEQVRIQREQMQLERQVNERLIAMGFTV